MVQERIPLGGTNGVPLPPPLPPPTTTHSTGHNIPPIPPRDSNPPLEVPSPPSRDKNYSKRVVPLPPPKTFTPKPIAFQDIPNLNILEKKIDDHPMVDKNINDSSVKGKERQVFSSSTRKAKIDLNKVFNKKPKYD